MPGPSPNRSAAPRAEEGATAAISPPRAVPSELGGTPGGREPPREANRYPACPSRTPRMYAKDFAMPSRGSSALISYSRPTTPW